MTTILQLNTSLFGDDGQSSSLANTFVERLRDRHPQSRLIQRDLGRDPIPHLSAECFTAALTPAEARSETQVEAARLADTLVSELMQTDILVIGSPTYNFSLPSSLKAWFDHVARAGTTFRYTENGPEGLLNMRAYVFISSGGFYKETEMDFQSRYIGHFLGFLGVDNVEFTYLEGTAMGEDVLNKSIRAARKRLQALAA